MPHPFDVSNPGPPRLPVCLIIGEFSLVALISCLVKGKSGNCSLGRGIPINKVRRSCQVWNKRDPGPTRGVHSRINFDLISPAPRRPGVVVYSCSRAAYKPRHRRSRSSQIPSSFTAVSHIFFRASTHSTPPVTSPDLLPPNVFALLKVGEKSFVKGR